MNLIEFQDYPSTETPLNAENLNHNFNELNKANTYSEEEQVIGTWIDGKPLYRKVVDAGYLANAGRTTTTTGIKDIDSTTNIRGFAHKNDGEDIINLEGILTTFLYRKTSDILFMDTLADFSQYKAYVILEYTKTIN